MGTKLKPARFDCYRNALPDEPMFILLARDESSPLIVRLWARHRLADIAQGLKPDADRAMAFEAFECAQLMVSWRLQNLGRWRKPPPPDPITTALGDVIKERHRQITDEGYTPDHDDAHAQGEIADAGLAYVIASDPNADGADLSRQLWPFEGDVPVHDRRHALVCGAALFIAEIERLDRLAARSAA